MNLLVLDANQPADLLFNGEGEAFNVRSSTQPPCMIEGKPDIDPGRTIS